MPNPVALTTTSLLAYVSDVLLSAGYRQVEILALRQWSVTNSRLFEDPYAIVAVVAYETWGELTEGWPQAQAELVEVMSTHLTSADAKTWDGYLVLLTPSGPGIEQREQATEIRRDTRRVRKLMATSEEVKVLSDVGRVLLPLLPLEEIEGQGPQGALAEVPSLLARQGLPIDAVSVVVDAFVRQEPLLERLHNRQDRHETS